MGDRNIFRHGNKFSSDLEGKFNFLFIIVFENYVHIIDLILPWPNLNVYIIRTEKDSNLIFTVHLQWLEHGWLVHHGYFELVVESQRKNSIPEDLG